MPAPDAYDRSPAGSGACVADHMSRRILAVRDDCGLGTAMDTVLASGHRHVVAVNPSGTFRGLLTSEEVTLAWMTRLEDRGQLVRELLIGPPLHLSPDASMHTAASVMLSNCVDAVGVTDPDGRPVGILTWADLVAMVANRESA